MYPTLSLGSQLQVPTYFLVLSLAACTSLVWVDRRAFHQDLPRKEIYDLSFIVLLLGFTGARLFHVLYEDPSYYYEKPFRILQIWNGGFVYFGGAISGILAGIFYYFRVLKKPRTQLGQYLDLFAPVASFGYMFGRVGCFFAGCCYGRFCDLPWAVAGRHPTQIYAVLWEAGTLLLLLGFEQRKHQPGQVFSLWLILHGIGRFVMEMFRDDFRGPIWLLSISTWLALGLIILGSFLFRRRKSLKS